MRAAVTALRAIAASLVAAACGSSSTPRPSTSDRPVPESLRGSARPASPTPGSTGTIAPLCLPVVHGCGCAYRCGRGVEQLPTGQWRVAFEPPQAVPVLAKVHRLCFDERGHVKTDGERCLDVFDENSPCGGECVPSNEYFGCRAEGDRCVW